jgi:hypothetical protein
MSKLFFREADSHKKYKFLISRNLFQKLKFPLEQIIS